MTPAQPLFRRLIGETFDQLPAAVRCVHSPNGALHTTGRAEVTGATSLGARLLRIVAGLPRPGRDVAVTVTFTPVDHGERWGRLFAGRRYASVMAAGQGADAGRLIEHFGPLFDLVFQLDVHPDGLHWRVERWKFLGRPLPVWTTPHIRAVETEEAGRFVFDIRVAFPLIGHVVDYRGWLDVTDGATHREKPSSRPTIERHTAAKK
jgi:hypothetical protein